MEMTNCILTVALAILCTGCDNGIRQVHQGKVVELSDGKLLEPGDYYHLTDNPKVLWQDEYVQTTVKKILTKPDKSQQETVVDVKVVVYIPTEKVTKEIMHGIQQTNIKKSELLEWIQAKADEEGWTVFEEIESRGRMGVPVVRNSTVRPEISLFEIRPDLKN